MKTGQDYEPTFDLELANVMSGIGPSRADYCLHRLPCQGHKRSSLDVFAYALYQNTTSWHSSIQEDGTKAGSLVIDAEGTQSPQSSR